MKYGHVVARAILTVCALAGGAPSRANAGVPESVAVRQQPKEVEEVIVPLEAKAQAAVGRWELRTGPQDAPAEPWVAGVVDGRAWYLESAAAAPARSAGQAVYFDGETAYVPLFGEGGASGGIQFQYDTLLRDDVGLDYRLGHFLMHVNLMPRTFLGALGGLQVVGQEDLDGVRVTHLRADPKRDTLRDNDPAFKLERRPPAPVVDLYIDPQRRAVVKAVFADPGGNVVTAAVTAWDAFGTGGQWPRTLQGARSAPLVLARGPRGGGGGGLRPTNKPVLTTVERFTPGAGRDAADRLRTRVAAQEFFVTRPADLRASAFYKAAAAAGGAVNDRVAWATACWVLDKDVTEGVRLWDELDSRLLSAAGKARLAGLLTPAAASALATESEAVTQQQACVALLRRLAAADDATVRQVGQELVVGWDRLRNLPPYRTAVAAITPTLLSRVSSLGNVFAVQRLTRLAEAQERDALLIDPHLAAVLARPVVGEFADSPQDFVIVSAVRENALPRVRRYLASLTWGPDAKAADREVAAAWAGVLDTAEGLRDGREGGLLAAADWFARLKTASFAGDVTNTTYMRSLLAKAAMGLTRARLGQPDKPPPEVWMREAARRAGAQELWHMVLTHLATESTLEPDWALTRLGPALHAYAEVFGDKTFETDLWKTIAWRPEVRGKYLGIEVQYLNKALSAAPDDDSRAAVITQLASTFGQAREYAKGAAAVAAVSDLVQDKHTKERLAKVVDELRRLEHAPTQAGRPTP
jgi:hypothetical protein